MLSLMSNSQAQEVSRKPQLPSIKTITERSTKPTPRFGFIQQHKKSLKSPFNFSDGTLEQGSELIIRSHGVSIARQTPKHSMRTPKAKISTEESKPQLESKQRISLAESEVRDIKQSSQACARCIALESELAQKEKAQVQSIQKLEASSQTEDTQILQAALEKLNRELTQPVAPQFEDTIQLKQKIQQLTYSNEQLNNRVDSQNKLINLMQKEILELKAKLSEKPKNLNIQQDIHKQLEIMRSSRLHMRRSLECKLCSKMLSNTVTVIPCAHNYCHDCKKGYQKQCFICGQNQMKEAVYHNLFMDEMIKTFHQLNEMIRLIEQVF